MIFTGLEGSSQLHTIVSWQADARRRGTGDDAASIDDDFIGQVPSGRTGE
jgi:hypothetical protein